MNKTATAQQPKTTSLLPPAQGLLQRQCSCGNRTATGGESTECAKKKHNLQRKLSIGASKDPLEHEADRVADQVMSMQANATLKKAPVRIQRYSGQPNQGEGTAPASVDHILSSTGRPLEPSLRNDMEQRFGHDFSHVRVHTGGRAEQSARDVNSNAYTVGNNVVFGARQFAPQTQSGQRLLAHELTHVMQQACSRSAPQRNPKLPKPASKAKSSSGIQESDKKYPAYESADSIMEISRDNETWSLTLNGFTDKVSLTRLIWPYLAPPGPAISLKVAITDPIERGWFTLTGIIYEVLKMTRPFAMEPSISKLFVAHGLEDEETESAAVIDARKAFRANHKGHGDWVLNHIDLALRQVTKRNPELLISYYKYYENHELKDETNFYTFDGINFNPEKNLGATARGNTLIHPSLLRHQPPSHFSTDDKTSLLASTLVHEYTPTPQPGTSDPVTKAQFESKAYGVEKFFSERMGDKSRANFISRRSTNDKLDQISGGDKIFDATQKVMAALYRQIDNGGPPLK